MRLAEGTISEKRTPRHKLCFAILPIQAYRVLKGYSLEYDAD